MNPAAPFHKSPFAATAAAVATLAIVATLAACGAASASAAAHARRSSLRAQNPDEMLPAESSAKAQAILAQTAEALGGPVYLNARNSECIGRYAGFEHSGELGAFIHLHSYSEFPDKRRVQYDARGTIVDLYSGKQGWTMDRGGITELPDAQIADFQDQLQTDINNILRYHLQDPTPVFRYAGQDVVDVTEVDWVEIVDRNGHTIRAAISRSRHLPVRVVVIERDPELHVPVQHVTAYANYHTLDGMQVPFQISRFVGDRQLSQQFYESCKFNQQLPANMFTRESLDQHFAAEHGRGKK